MHRKSLFILHCPEMYNTPLLRQPTSPNQYLDQIRSRPPSGVGPVRGWSSPGRKRLGCVKSKAVAARASGQQKARGGRDAIKWEKGRCTCMAKQGRTHGTGSCVRGAMYGVCGNPRVKSPGSDSTRKKMGQALTFYKISVL